MRVEWKKLHSIVKSISTGLNPRSNFILNEDGASLYYVTVKEITTNKVVFSSSTDKITEQAKLIINNRSKLAKGDILFSGIGTIGKVAYVNISTDNWDCSESVFLIKPEKEIVNGKYLSYILLSDVAKEQYEKGSAGSIMKGVRKASLENILIPIPSLEEQTRLVGILDTFTSAIDNLKEQIAQRRKQYEHYRDKLLDLEGKEGVEMKTLGEVATIKVGPFGSLLHKKDYIKDGIPLVNPVHMINGKIEEDCSFSVSNEMAKHLSSYRLKPEDIVFARRGEIGRCAIVTQREDGYLCGTGSLIVRFDEKLHSKYMLYLFLSPFCRNYLEKSAIGGSMLNINCTIVAQMRVPLPSLEEQSRIVSILDTFEASIQNKPAKSNTNTIGRNC